MKKKKFPRSTPEHREIDKAVKSFISTSAEFAEEWKRLYRDKGCYAVEES